MDGRGRWMDNVFIERLWRSLKHGGLPQGLCRRPRGAGRHRRVDRLLQPAPAASGAGWAGADGGVAGGRHRPARCRGCGHDAALGQRWRVAHRPTATAAETAPRGLIIEEVEDGSASNHKPAPTGPTHGVHLRHLDMKCAQSPSPSHPWTTTSIAPGFVNTNSSPPEPSR